LLAALPGALTLVLDLLENERKHNIQFDHLFIEAGTGFSASALILGLNWIEHPANIHVILLAEEEEAFLTRLNQCQEMFTQFIQTFSSLSNHFTIHYPVLTKGFGQIHPSLFETILHIARNEGFLTDPIYSAKLFIESRRLIIQEKLKGNILILHSGGSLTLMGFQHQLHKTLS
jgi:1-aminocyclopropane-1-carboxylate deaminase